jgi:hypothetical protein
MRIYAKLCANAQLLAANANQCETMRSSAQPCVRMRVFVMPGI